MLNCREQSVVGPLRLAGTDPSNSDTATAACVGCVCTRSRGFVRTRVRACVRDLFAIYDNNFLPRLKNNILHFIHIRHTDDFASTGNRLVLYNIINTTMCKCRIVAHVIATKLSFNTSLRVPIWV